MGHGTEIELLIDRTQNDWIQTYTGRKFHFLRGDPKEVHVEDLARGLAQRCRWSGMYKRDYEFYSVAQHSVYAARLAPTRSAKRLALMHDAPEWVTGDMSKPVKMHLPDFIQLEDKIMDVIAKRFGIKGSPALFGLVKTIDNWLLWTEAEQMLTNPGLLAEWQCPRLEWRQAPKRFRIPTPGWGPRRAETEFLSMYRSLWNV